MSYERTLEHRVKMSKALKGKKKNYPSASTKPEVAAKIQRWWTDERREVARQRGKKLAADRAWRDLIAQKVSGELNPNFQGKNNSSPYSPGWGRLHRRLIRERAGYKCEICEKSSRFLDLHHKDFSKDNHHPDNIQAVCRSCHKLLHGEHRRAEPI